MDFSLCLASRERPQLLRGLLSSLALYTADPTMIEVIVGIDDDDEQTHEQVNAMSRQFPFARFWSRERSPWLNQDYINAGYLNYGRGKFAVALNDDTEFTTNGWDTLAWHCLESFLKDKPDRIAYGSPGDSLPRKGKRPFSCFPFVSREAVQALGFIMPPQYPSWVADTVLAHYYEGVDRIVPLPILIQHHSHHCGSRAKDNIDKHVRAIHKRYHPRARPEIAENVARLRKAIEAHSIRE